MTQSRFNPQSASRHYRQLELASRVGAASPHALVALLYEELLNALDTTIVLAKSEVVLTNSSHVIKARSILVALKPVSTSRMAANWHRFWREFIARRGANWAMRFAILILKN